MLAADYTNHARLVSEQAEKVTHYNILRREVDTNRQLYESMFARVKEAAIASALRASNIRIVEAATPPTAPYKPQPSRNASLGLLAGLFIGVALVIVRERTDRTIRDPGEVSACLNVTEMGVIPSSVVEQQRRLLPLPVRASTGVHLNDSVRSQYSVTREAFGALLTSLLFCGENGDRPRTLVLSSANPEEGKTTVASNLAIALAGVNYRVLLIDGDMRKPQVHKIFDLKNETGLADLLTEPTMTLPTVVRESAIPKLFVLTSGRPHSAATRPVR